MSENTKLLMKNRKAYYEYSIIDELEAGIVLLGTEVKSLRAKNFDFQDCYAQIKGGELWLVNLHISPYRYGNINNHDPKRDRKLLVNKRELRKLTGKLKEKGLTLVPLRVYLKNGLVKVALGLGKGKKLYDKRDTAQKRESDKELKRTLKDFAQGR